MEPEDQEQCPAAEEHEDDQDEHPYADGVNYLLEAAANVLEKDEFVKAISGWVSSWTQKRPIEIKLHTQSMWTSAVFGLALFFGIGVLGYLKVIPPEATTGLLGALIGYWYGTHEKSN